MEDDEMMDSRPPPPTNIYSKLITTTHKIYILYFICMILEWDFVPSHHAPPMYHTRYEGVQNYELRILYFCYPSM